MCPPFLIFFNWPGLSPIPALPAHLKKVIRTEVIEKKIALTPPTFSLKFVLNPPQPPGKKKSNWL